MTTNNTNLRTHEAKSDLSESFPALNLPELPALVRYEDTFTSEQHVLRDLENDIWHVYALGSKAVFRFDAFAHDLRPLLRFMAYESLLSSSPGVFANRLRALSQIEPTLRSVILSSPRSIRNDWAKAREQRLSEAAYLGLKQALRTLCNLSLLHWTPLWTDLLTTLPLPTAEKWAALRTGEAFLSIDEEAALIRRLDEVSTTVASSPNAVDDAALVDASLVVCSYQFGMRPVQIGMVSRNDYREYRTEDGTKSVHLTFRMVKQRTKALEGLPLVRKVKREWSPIFIELYRRGTQRNESGATKLFGLPSSAKAVTRIADALSDITGGRRTATDVRHTAAQRLVDAGASSEELAEFMGHSDVSTGLIYFDTSANQAERVNKALGISETYTRVARIAHARFISDKELAELKEDQQIAGVPHGIPIAGIGGCETGQPSCPYNPVTACYGCDKFMPVADVALHQRVLTDFRSVVTFFNETSRGESASPAYLQLRGTIDSVQAVIDELTQAAHE